MFSPKTSSCLVALFKAMDVPNRIILILTMNIQCLEKYRRHGSLSKSTGRPKKQGFFTGRQSICTFHLKCFPLAENVIGTSLDKRRMGHNV